VGLPVYPSSLFNLPECTHTHNTCMHKRMPHTHTHTHTHARMHARTHARTHAHTHTHAHICVGARARLGASLMLPHHQYDHHSTTFLQTIHFTVPTLRLDPQPSHSEHALCLERTGDRGAAGLCPSGLGTRSRTTSYVYSPIGRMLPFTVTQSICRTLLRTWEPHGKATLTSH
jgi:hypothetical protein